MTLPPFRNVVLTAALALFGASASACGVVGAGEIGSCDRRAVVQKPKPFCQEIIETVALREFREDCQNRLAGKYVDGTCPREKALGGCAQDATNEDGSLVVEWFYDTSGDPKAKQYPAEDTAKTVADVKRFCADRKRYELSSMHFVSP
ncbi:MAG: hypothetical protein IPG50_35635 [Myxococcales bacterium]|nr:hypothetical protein [Myxococcales bacterium]